MTTSPVMSSVEWLLPTTLSLLWGGSFFFTESRLPAAAVQGRARRGRAGRRRDAERPSAAARSSAVGRISGDGRTLSGLALLSTAFAYVINFRILARAGATNLLLVTFLIPVSARAGHWRPGISAAWR